ncbi:MAG: hypothetical protein HKN18_06275 [Silicimonas sp.]|nr:hypothetical protein [Silicimonas sp.]
MRLLWRGAKWLAVSVVLLVVLLLMPVAYTEVACRGTPVPNSYQPLITDPAWQRAESRTLMTYPEWHIVHAYDDYAKVIAIGDPHDFAYLRAVAGFWQTLCPLARKSAEMGGVTTETKMTIYTIGVSFTAELLAKALYEETLGRLAALVRGTTRASLDDLSAGQAAAYAAFLQQTPWYKWDFNGDRAELASARSDGFRDRERALALGLEYSAKAAYARVIAQAVASVGADELRIRSVVTDLSAARLRLIDGVSVIAELPEGVVIETDRYREFTNILQRLAVAGADIAEIAGNDDILITTTGPNPDVEGPLYSFLRQGYGDWRHLRVLPVADLASQLRQLNGAQLEHVHDY